METKYIILLAVAGVIILLAVLLSANSRLMNLFKKYDKEISSSGLTTQEFLIAAKQTLNIEKLTFARIKGNLTDCYVPSKRIIALSDSTYNNKSVAAIAVASHEFGHALQHHFSPILFNFVRVLGFVSRVFSRLVLPTVFASIIMIIFSATRQAAIIMLWASLGVVVAGFLFRIFTIPVEYNASKRAKKLLHDYHVLNEEEQKWAKKIFSAAAFTYVADFISTTIGLNFIRRKIRN